MSETAEKIIYVTTNGPESREKATLPFKLANAGLALDLDVVMALQRPAVYQAMPSMITHVEDVCWSAFPVCKRETLRKRILSNRRSLLREVHSLKKSSVPKPF